MDKTKRGMSRRAAFASALADAREGWVPEDYSQHIMVPDRRIAIASDVHLPYYDEDLMARFLADCAEYGVESIVWLGDLLDHHTWSHWGVTDHSAIYKRELRMVNRLVRLAGSVVKAQYWSSGNHEDRLFRKTDHQIGMEQLALMAGLGDMLEDNSLIISDHASLDAVPDTHGKPTWLLTHPASYSPTPLITPGKLAQRFGMNVAAAHAHHWGMGVDPSGQYTCIETGGMFKPEYHRYAQYGVTAHRAWVRGYWFLLDGRPMGVLG